MRYRQVDLNLFVVFDALIREGSVSKAAKSLGVSQGAVSQALAKLRVHFGDELFLRRSTGVTPTATALALAEDVRQFVALSEAALVGRAAFDPLASDRDIRLCMADMGELTILPSLLTKLQQCAPRCRVIILDLWGDELRNGFERGEVDIAINARRPPPGDLLQQKLFQDSYVVMMSKANRLEGPVTLAEVESADHVAMSAGRLDHVRMDSVFERHGLRRNIRASVANWISIPHILQAQPDLISIVPNFLAQAYKRFDLKTAPLAFDLPRVEVFQFWHRRVNTDPFSLWLRGTLREIFVAR